MITDHLTDETLQAFLLKDIQNDAITLHLAECQSCHKKLEEYQYLIGGISKIASETFSFDVTTVVMDKITLYDQKKSKKEEFVFWFFLTSLLIVISSMSIPFMPIILSMLYSKSIFSTLLFIVTGLVVLLFLITDVYRQYKVKEEKIFNYNVQPII